MDPLYRVAAPELRQLDGLRPRPLIRGHINDYDVAICEVCDHQRIVVQPNNE